MGGQEHIELHIRRQDTDLEQDKPQQPVSLWSHRTFHSAHAIHIWVKLPLRAPPCRFFTQMKRVRVVFTSAVLPTEIGKSPHVAQSNCITHARQEEIKFPPPRLPVGQILLILLGLHVQGLWLVIARGHLVQFRHLSVRLGAVRRHVSGFGRGPGSRTGGFSTSPRRQQLRGLIRP